jgi:hypothetical protein
LRAEQRREKALREIFREPHDLLREQER